MRWVLLALVGLVLAGCTATQWVRLDGTEPDPLDAQNCAIWTGQPGGEPIATDAMRRCMNDRGYIEEIYRVRL